MHTAANIASEKNRLQGRRHDAQPGWRPWMGLSSSAIKSCPIFTIFPEILRLFECDSPLRFNQNGRSILTIEIDGVDQWPDSPEMSASPHISKTQLKNHGPNRKKVYINIEKALIKETGGSKSKRTSIGRDHLLQRSKLLDVLHGVGHFVWCRIWIYGEGPGKKWNERTGREDENAEERKKIEWTFRERRNETKWWLVLSRLNNQAREKSPAQSSRWKNMGVNRAWV